MGRSILLDAFTIASLTLIVRLAGTAKSVVAARFLGAGDALDCYLVAFLIPSFLGDVLAGSIGPALVPNLIAAAECDGAAAFEAVYADALYRGAILLSVTGCCVLACAHFLLRIMASAFNPDKLSLSYTLLIVMLPIMPLSAIGVVWRSVLNAKGRFSAAAVSPAMTPALIIGCLILLTRQYGVVALGVGTTIGCVAELWVLAAAVRSARIPVMPSWTRGRTANPGIGQQYVSIVISSVALGGTAIVNQAMAATLGPGSVSVLMLSSRAVSLLLMIGPTALMIALLPALAQLAARDQWLALRRLVRQSVLMSMTALAVVSAVLFVCSKPIVQFVFQGGRFTASDTLAVAHLQAMLVCQLPFVVGSAILMRVVVLLKLGYVLMFVSACSVALSLALNELFMQHYGLFGIAIGNTLSQILVLVVLICYVFRALNRLCERDRRTLFFETQPAVDFEGQF